MKRALIAIVTLLAATPIMSFSEETNTLTTFRARYEAVKAGIERDWSQQRTNALAAYGQTLQATMQTLKSKGDLDGFLAVETEKKRFDKDGTVPAETGANQPTVVMQTVLRYRAAVDAAEAERNRRQIDLLKRYTTTLSTLVKQYTMQEKIDDAKAAKAELERAQTLLALYETSTPAPKEAAAPAEVEEPPKPKVEDEITGTWIVKYDNGVTRTYQFTKDGRAVKNEAKWGMGKGTWRMQDGVMLVELDDGKLESWERMDDEVWGVKHFSPKSRYPSGMPVASGAAKKQPEAGVPATKLSKSPSVQTRLGDRDRKPIPPEAASFAGHHYLVVKGEKQNLDWRSAKSKARLWGGHLAVITSQEEQDFVNGLVVKESAFYCFIGHFKQGRHWKNVTDEDSDYSRFQFEDRKGSAADGAVATIRDMNLWWIAVPTGPKPFVVEWDY